MDSLASRGTKRRATHSHSHGGRPARTEREPSVARARPSAAAPHPYSLDIRAATCDCRPWRCDTAAVRRSWVNVTPLSITLMAFPSGGWRQRRVGERQRVSAPHGSASQPLGTAAGARGGRGRPGTFVLNHDARLVILLLVRLRGLLLLAVHLQERPEGRACGWERDAREASAGGTLAGRAARSAPAPAAVPFFEKNTSPIRGMREALPGTMPGVSATLLAAALEKGVRPTPPLVGIGVTMLLKASFAAAFSVRDLVLELRRSVVGISSSTALAAPAGAAFRFLVVLVTVSGGASSFAAPSISSARSSGPPAARPRARAGFLAVFRTVLAAAAPSAASAAPPPFISASISSSRSCLLSTSTIIASLMFSLKFRVNSASGIVRTFFGIFSSDNRRSFRSFSSAAFALAVTSAGAREGGSD